MENEITIDRINNYLKSQLWMDFTLSSTDPGTVELIGRIDEAGGKVKIKIHFQEPYLIISPLYFTYEGKNDFIAVLKDEYAYKKTLCTIFVKGIHYFNYGTQILKVTSLLQREN